MDDIEGIFSEVDRVLSKEGKLVLAMKDANMPQRNGGKRKYDECEQSRAVGRKPDKT